MIDNLSLPTSADEAARLSVFIRGVTDYAIYMLSPDGHVVSWNAGAQRFKGYTADEIIGQHFSRFYTQQDQDQDVPAHALQSSAETGKFEAQGWRVRKDGSLFWCNVVIDPIRDEAGTLIGFAKITRDITESKQAQLQFEATREELFHAQKLEAIGKLTGGIAHDFNNLLNVMGNGISMLRPRLTEAADLRILDTMERVTKRGATVTKQLLGFARKEPLKHEQHDLNLVIATFEEVLRRATPGGIEFALELAPRLPQVMIDAAQFETAILNLIVNARDAMPEGGRITVSTQDMALEDNEVGKLPAGRYGCVSVSDTGGGMTPEVLARAVEPFFTTKEFGKGTGLGLSQVLRLLHEAGGDLAIHSRPGAGSTVSMYFPGLAVGTREPTAPAVVQKVKVLVVDDDPDALQMTVDVFRTLGFDVLSATNGRDALDVLRRTPGVKTLFSDVVMPGMDGINLAHQARLAAPQVRVILVSGHPGDATVDGSLDGFPFLPKPYRLADVLQKLEVVGQPLPPLST